MKLIVNYDVNSLKEGTIIDLPLSAIKANSKYLDVNGEKVPRSCVHMVSCETPEEQAFIDGVMENFHNLVRVEHFSDFPGEILHNFTFKLFFKDGSFKVIRKDSYSEDGMSSQVLSLLWGLVHTTAIDYGAEVNVYIANRNLRHGPVWNKYVSDGEELVPV